MKKITLLLFLLFGTSMMFYGQDSIVINYESINDSYINTVKYYPDGHAPTLVAAEWTYGGIIGTGRSLIKFDLSKIPPYAKIEHAGLYLYHDPTSMHVGHSQLGGDNTGIINRIVDEWDDEEVTWYTQPHTTNTNAVLIHPTIDEDRDYPNINVTEMVQDMVNHPDNQQGFMLKLLSEELLYRSLVFASVDHNNPLLRPYLKVFYSADSAIVFDTIIHFKPNPETGKDAYINSVLTEPRGDQQTLVAAVWTYAGEVGTGRFLIDFPLDQLPSGYKIAKAELNLYHDPISHHIGHSTLGGENSLIIQRIIDNWDEHTVTWYNQPETTSENEVLVDSSNMDNQHYLNIDVTKLVYDPREERDYIGKGFLIRLVNESDLYRSVVFASSDHPYSDLRPELTVYLKKLENNGQGGSQQGVNDTQDEADFTVFPNPCNGIFNIKKYVPGEANIEVVDLFGRTVLKSTIENKLLKLNLMDQPQGTYIIHIRYQENTFVKKINLIR